MPSIEDLRAALVHARYQATFGTCARRQIGCAALDRDGSVVVATSNGPPRSMGSCLDGTVQCSARDVPAGQSNAATACYGVHAEQRAIQAYPKLRAVVSTKAPCTSCVLQLLETPCETIAFETASNETTNRELWEAAGRTWLQL